MLPDYWLERPPLSLDATTEAAIEELLASLSSGSGELDIREVARRHDVTLWTLLCGLAERRAIAFHGTGDPGIEMFEPHHPIEFGPFGDQKAVFATSDPIWAMFYAVVDRDRYEISLVNGCVTLTDDDGRQGVPHYFFSISRQVREHEPWRTGYLYLLPSETFVEQPSGPFAGQVGRIPQLASPVPVRPSARLAIAPDDFPFLEDIGGHDDDRLAEYAEAVMSAAPWPE